MAKPKVTRTYGPIHFEDLDPHRFEDLVRELIYDYKDWQTIEATGRGGADEGFDIRAYERADGAPSTESDEEDEDKHPMMGNRWMVQCKREKQIGPKRVEQIIEEIDSKDPPYGYILAASTSFSKQSYDVFRDKLLQKGVMEFYLWGVAELEDMLHLPKNDRILFTFFGISLVSRRRSRSTEIRFAVNNKNKLFRVFGDDIGGSRPVLLRDTKDTDYPYRGKYKDFKEHPRWREFPASEYHPLGLIMNIHKYFAYFDIDKKEFDFSSAVSLVFRESDSNDEREEQRIERDKVEDFWEHLPQRQQATYCRDGLVRYDEMLVIDDKGDTWYKFPHIFVDFDGANGPFGGSAEYLEVGTQGYGGVKTIYLKDWTKVEVFPNTFPEPKIGTVHRDKIVEFDQSTLQMFIHNNQNVRQFFDVDGKYDFLEQRDVIPVANSTENGKSPEYIQITHKMSMIIKDYLKETGEEEYTREQLERRVGRKIKPTEKVTIFEFKRTYEWKFDPSKKIGF